MKKYPTGYRGARPAKGKPGRWRARIYRDVAGMTNSEVIIGEFGNRQGAARAYDGEIRRTNPPSNHLKLNDPREGELGRPAFLVERDGQRRRLAPRPEHDS